MSDRQLEIAFASTEDEAVEIHGFLCVISQPVLMAPIDAQDSMTEILRVLKEGVAITARLNGHLIGSLGIISVPWWYNKQVEFMTDRWLFVLPQFHHIGVGARLQMEAQTIATEAGMDLVITGHLRRRNNGVFYNHPKVQRKKVN
jgi:hypothetical protein